MCLETLICRPTAWIPCIDIFHFSVSSCHVGFDHCLTRKPHKSSCAFIRTRSAEQSTQLDHLNNYIKPLNAYVKPSCATGRRKRFLSDSATSANLRQIGRPFIWTDSNRVTEGGGRHQNGCREGGGHGGGSTNSAGRCQVDICQLFTCFSKTSCTDRTCFLNALLCGWLPKSGVRWKLDKRSDIVRPGPHLNRTSQTYRESLQPIKLICYIMNRKKFRLVYKNEQMFCYPWKVNWKCR